MERTERTVSYRLAIQYAAEGTPKMKEPSPTKTVWMSLPVEGERSPAIFAPMAAPSAHPREEAPELMSEPGSVGPMWFQT
jgi:hypothetical protein